MSNQDKPGGISIIVTTYNWKEALELVLLSVFSQTRLPNEIIVADDGSRSDTKEMIEALKKKSPIPIIHTWQEDKGFRLSMIRNKAIATARHEYIIQIDGDCVLDKYFIQDHIESAKKGAYVCGSRTCCDKEFSEEWFSTKAFNTSKFHPVKGSYLNQFRVGFLRRYILSSFPITIKGCNMAFWRDDIISVNGYDEGYEGWGYEDHDMALRLDNNGLKKKTLKMGAVMYHLYHKERNADLKSEEYANRMKKMQYIREHKIIWVEDGINKYL